MPNKWKGALYSSFHDLLKIAGRNMVMDKYIELVNRSLNELIKLIIIK